MLEYKLNDTETIKCKEGLSETEYIAIIDVTIEAYKDGIGNQKDLLGVVPYNPIKAQQAFYRALCEMCIEDYDNQRFSEYFEAGIPSLLISEVKNASEALNTVNNIINNSMSLSVTLNNFLSGILNMLDEKLPDGADLTKVLKKFPKDLSKALINYTEVMTPSKEEFDEKEKNGEYKGIEEKKTK